MKPPTTNSAVLSLRCTHRTSGGRRCRLSVSGPSSTLCPQHRAEQLEEEAADHFPYLSRNFQLFQTAQGINHALMNLYQLLAQNRISPRRAAVLSYISSLLLRTLPQIDADKAAGIIDPSKPIDIPVADEEDSDLASGDDEESETESETVTDVDPNSTNTWDASIPEPDPKKKPS